MKDLINRWVILIGVGLTLSACNNLDEEQAQGVKMGQLYQQSDYDNLERRWPTVGVNEGFVRTQNNELHTTFPMLPNPVLTMFVFPHLTKQGYPVPGYSTHFKLYERDHYALPGEIY